jgi:tRNA (guanine-N7-)-methyltransferase
MPFTKPCRIELDIGCGRGSFLQRIAMENNGTEFIGIDIDEYACARAQNRCQAAGLTNVLICHSEALKFLREVVPESRISAFHIYFPSPWIGEIRDHNALGADVTGRLVTTDFLREVIRTASDGAVIRFVTDHHSYFTSVVRFLERQGFVAMPWIGPTKRREHGMLLATDWEAKIRERFPGREILYYQGLI